MLRLVPGGGVTTFRRERQAPQPPQTAPQWPSSARAFWDDDRFATWLHLRQASLARDAEFYDY